jgi:hypothetical protein
MVNWRLLVKRDTRRAIDCLIDYFGDPAAPAHPATRGERVLEFLRERDGHPAFVPMPVPRAEMRGLAPSPRSRRFA